MHKTLIALTSAAALAQGASADIVGNGGFESGTGSDADAWNEIPIFGGGASATVARTDAAPAEGSWHMVLSVEGAGDFGPAAVLQQQTSLGSVSTGDITDFGVLARRDGALGPGVVVFLEVQWLDSDGSHGGGVKGTTGLMEIGGQLTDSYQSFGFNGAVVATDADAALIIMSVIGGAFDGSDGSAYFDHATLTVVPAPASLLLAGPAALGAIRRRRR